MVNSTPAPAMNGADAKAQVVRTVGELLLAAIVLIGGGLMLWLQPLNQGIMTLVATSIGAIIGYYYGGKRGGQGGTP